MRAVFIRAPWIAEHGPTSRSSPRSTATRCGRRAACSISFHPELGDVRQGGLLAISFHPELGDDDRLHRAFLEQVRAARNGAG